MPVEGEFTGKQSDELLELKTMIAASKKENNESKNENNESQNGESVNSEKTDEQNVRWSDLGQMLARLRLGSTL